MPDSRNCPSFLSDSAGGPGLLPRKPQAVELSRPSSPLVLPEQHDGERRPARHSGTSARPSAGCAGASRSRWAPGCRTWLPAQPKQVLKTLQELLDTELSEVPRGHRRGRHLTADNWQLGALFFWVKGGPGMGSCYFYLILFFMME